MAKIKPMKADAEFIIVNFKATPAEKKRIKANANRYAEGNISLWMRYCALHCVPKRGDSIERKSVKVS